MRKFPNYGGFLPDQLDERRRLADLDDSIGFNGVTVRAMIQF